jgi:hypothetical protein
LNGFKEKEMEEKKLTDEEIVKALECCTQEPVCNNCPIKDKDYCSKPTTLFLEIVKLIKSQKAEIERLTREYERIAYNKQEYLEWVDGFLRTHTVMKDRGEDYKMFDREWMCNTFWAKIEGSLDYIIDLENQRNELQKQVDELKEENAQLSEMADYDKGHKEGYEHGAKTTAKEILQGFDKWLKQAISDSYNKSVSGSIRHGGMNTAFHEVKELVKRVAESKGVEVE